MMQTDLPFPVFALADESGHSDRMSHRYMQMMNRRDRTPAYHAEAAEDGTSAEMHLYDIIGDEWCGCIGAKTVAAFLDAHPDIEELTLRINSPGGDVFEGVAIYNRLRDHKALINVYIDGLAASIASVIAMCGDEIHMASNAAMLIHNPWGCMCGEAGDFDKASKMLDTIKQQVVNTYAARTGADESDIAAMMDAESYMTADEAKAKGFCDSVEPLKLKAAAFADDPMFAALLESISEEHKPSLEAIAEGEQETPADDQESSEEPPADPPVDNQETPSAEPPADNQDNSQAEPPADPPADEPQDPKAQLKRYIEAFGAEKGATWYADGLPFTDALLQHNKDLLAENAKLSEQMRQATGTDDEEPPVGSDPTGNDPEAAKAAAAQNYTSKGVGSGVASLAAGMTFAGKR